ncbi:MAG: DUF1453 domain-containing protein [Sphingomonas sp.]
MQIHHAPPNMFFQYIVPVAVFVMIFALRARRMSQIRPLKLRYLWIVPAIYLAVLIGFITAKPPGLGGWAILLVACALGAAIGWRRGMMMQISIDLESRALRQKGSPLAILFLLGIILVKMAAQAEGAALHFDAQLVTDAAFAFGLGMFGATRVEMYLRAKRLLADVPA